MKKQNIFESFKNYINEAGGQKPGKLELVKTKEKKAEEYLEKIGVEIPDFPTKFENAQRLATLGRTQRKDMPVITDNDVDELKARLEAGKLDVKAPYAPSTEKRNPFPEGLSGERAKDFLERGFKDGSTGDDIVEVFITRKVVGELKPIQQQIYFDKSADSIAEFGVEATIKFLSRKSFFIISSDDFIIDGHHRWLAGNLVDPTMEVNCLEIDMPIRELLELTKAYGDAIGNKRNA